MLLDGTVKNVAKIPGGPKSIKKSGGRVTVFSTKDHASEITNGSHSIAAVEIANILLLQEVDQLGVEKRNFKEFEHKSLRYLKDLQVALLDNRLTEDHLRSIKEVICDNQSKFSTPSLASLAEEVILRMEVELAKITVQRE